MTYEDVTLNPSESILMAIVNRSRGLPAVILEGWPADYLTAASLTGGIIQGLRMTPIDKLP